MLVAKDVLVLVVLAVAVLVWVTVTVDVDASAPGIANATTIASTMKAANTPFSIILLGRVKRIGRP